MDIIFASAWLVHEMICPWFLFPSTFELFCNINRVWVFDIFDTTRVYTPCKNLHIWIKLSWYHIQVRMVLTRILTLEYKDFLTLRYSPNHQHLLSITIFLGGGLLSGSLNDVCGSLWNQTLICEKLIEKKECVRTNDRLENKLMYLH